ncbi:hypothetical protein [Brucella sp. 10RB9215]|uniref:hypothetical protein n=1 Tax=Brucella sp. 10RB9215 TaxID=1149953 RepID=UPI0010FD07B2|nr:hypothetical protein [Brucella sp. 10RB9215]
METSVGAPLYNPAVDRNGTVTEIINNGSTAVVFDSTTNSSYAVLLAQSVGDTFTGIFVDADGNSHQTDFKVVSVTHPQVGTDADNNPIYGPATAVVVENQSNSGQSIVNLGAPMQADGAAGVGADPMPYVEPSGSSHTVFDVQKGKKGGDGRDGAVFVPASRGGRGADGPLITPDIPSHNITAVAGSKAGVYVASIGGDGGEGGSSTLNLAGGGKSGGAAGAGGIVNVTMPKDITINTSGQSVHGIFVQSAAGKGGKGGNSTATTGGGGAGGDTSKGGSVTLNTSVNVYTAGNDAIGIFAQSTGGAGGDGGNSYLSITGGGGGSYGGDGGSVTLRQDGSVQTGGSYAHGVLAQSIGGSGGHGGTSGGTIVSLGNDGGAGGNGGNVSLTAGSGSQTVTVGDGSVGLFAQSVGGGGGDGGTGVAIVAFGSTGGSGGNGGNVALNIEDGAIVQTGGNSADAVLAQSVGGGGGTGGISVGGAALGPATLGANGTSGGGHAGVVTLDSNGTIITTGKNARGLVGQSIGGGGGSAGGSTGLVALGSSGGAGGNGGDVVVTQHKDGSIVTKGAGSTGIFAQSVGGGGGSGGYGVGLVSMGAMVPAVAPAVL